MITRTAEEEITRILREDFLFGSDRPIPLDAPFGELGLGLDSLAVLNFVIAVENAFVVQLPDEILAAQRSLTVSRLAVLVARSPSVRPRAPQPGLLDPRIPPRHHRMERLGHALTGRGYLGHVLWAAARLAWPAKRFVFARSTHLLLERSLDVDSAPVAPPPGIELRAYVPADEKSLAGLWPDFTRRSSRQMVDRWLREGAIPLVASDGNRIVALDLLSTTGDPGNIELRRERDTCWGLYLVEAPDFRGRGIGLALLAHSLRVARERGFRAQLTAVRQDNKPMVAAAVQLLGFRRIGHAQRTHVLGVTRWSWEIDGRSGRARRLVI